MGVAGPLARGLRDPLGDLVQLRHQEGRRTDGNESMHAGVGRLERADRRRRVIDQAPTIPPPGGCG
jgi:hypothetical protein